MPKIEGETRTEIDLPEGATADLPAKPKLVTDARFHPATKKNKEKPKYGRGLRKVQHGKREEERSVWKAKNSKFTAISTRREWEVHRLRKEGKENAIRDLGQNFCLSFLLVTPRLSWVKS